MCNINIKPSYETNSFVYEQETIKLNLVKDNTEIIWKSSNDAIAVVKDGIVTGIKSGNVNINAYVNNECVFTFPVLVIKKEVEEVVKDLLEAHNSNIYHNDQIWIDGKNGYNPDIYESVSKLLFNDELIINDQFLEDGNKKWEKHWNEFLRSIEFITVHYTGNVSPRANAFMHGRYFVNMEEPTSIHYNTGNDGVYLCLDNNKRAAHAGDSLGPEFEWLDTGVEYDNCEINKVAVTVSQDFYYVVNGKKTLIKLPEPYIYKERKTKHEYLDNGFIKLQDTDILKKPEEMFNKMGFAFIVKNNKYYMSQTWWCYTQKYEGAICNVGGNRNSIGIESAVNTGSDVWYTWQKTAQLVAKLMKDNNLDINRVKGHHFFTAKNCPQPMMENNMEIWYKFIELVKVEYKFLTKYSDYKITFIPMTNNIDSKGRVLDSSEFIIKYKLIVTNKKTEENKFSIELASIVNNIN